MHFSRFHPDHKMVDVQITPIKTLLQIYRVSKEVGVLYPYLGNVPHGDYENTFCPNCGNLCIRRLGFSIFLSGIHDGKCVKCKNSIPIIY